MICNYIKAQNERLKQIFKKSCSKKMNVFLDDVYLQKDKVSFPAEHLTSQARD